MAKLLQFRKPDQGSGDSGSERGLSAAYEILDVPTQTPEIVTFRAKAKEDVRTMILMFDVALMHGRLAIRNMDDQEAKQRLEAHLYAIEEMLDLARARAVKL